MFFFGGKFALFQMSATRGGWDGVDACSKANSPATDNQWVRAFIGEGRELHAETAVSSDSHLEIGHQDEWSDQRHLD